MRRHLAIMHQSVIEAILLGRKTIETRFSKHRIVPFGAISVGDLVYLKPPGKEIEGQFRVKKVYTYDGLTTSDVEKIFTEFKSEIATGDQDFDRGYLIQKRGSLFGTVIFIGDSERFINLAIISRALNSRANITSPIKITKSDRRGWVVIG
ncbi:MAG: hypothetical protein Q7S88_00550 [Candidatus Daviesbacteria bacterium]|nr:hypothetical protein [Candidatus Daviesbacteria bacterium]